MNRNYDEIKPLSKWNDGQNANTRPINTGGHYWADMGAMMYNQNIPFMRPPHTQPMGITHTALVPLEPPPQPTPSQHPLPPPSLNQTHEPCALSYNTLPQATTSNTQEACSTLFTQPTSSMLPPPYQPHQPPGIPPNNQLPFSSDPNSTATFTSLQAPPVTASVTALLPPPLHMAPPVAPVPSSLPVSLTTLTVVASSSTATVAAAQPPPTVASRPTASSLTPLYQAGFKPEPHDTEEAAIKNLHLVSVGEKLPEASAKPHHQQPFSDHEDGFDVTTEDVSQPEEPIPRISGTDYLTAKPGCKTCDAFFSNQHECVDDLEGLKEFFDIQKRYKCKVCNKGFDRADNMKRHLKIHLKEPKHQCEDCGATFLRGTALQRHKLKHKGKTIYECNKCEMSFVDERRYRQHIASHSGKKYMCKICDECFADKVDLEKHEKIHTSERPFKCTICNKTYRHRKELNKHVYTHAEEKPYPCNQCNKSFQSESLLKDHARTHKKPFTCQTCGKSFAKGNYLIKHQIVHNRGTVPAPHKCNVCHREFNWLTSLQVHMLSHSTNNKPFICELCGKGFPLKIRLLKHLRIHSDEKPFSCDHCGKRFNTKFQMMSHRAVHTGERAHKCDLCSKCFRFRSNLNAHRKICPCLSNR